MLKALRRAHPGYEILSALADRELTAADAMKINAHLVECQDCREEVDFMVQLRDRLRSIDGPPPPHMLLQDILNLREMGQRVVLQEAPEPVEYAESRLKRVLPAAAIAILAGGGFAVFGPSEIEAGGSRLQVVASGLSGRTAGAPWRIDYRTAGPLADRDQVIARAEYVEAELGGVGRNRSGIIEAVVDRKKPGRFLGELSFPSSAAFARIVIEAPDGEYVDDGFGVWEALAKENGVPTYNALLLKLEAEYERYDMRAASETALRLKDKDPDRPAGWFWAAAIEASIDPAGAERRAASHQQRLLKLIAELPERAAADDLAILARFAIRLGAMEVHADLVDRLTAIAPRDPAAAYGRALQLMSSSDDDPSRLEALEAEWDRYGASHEELFVIALDAAARSENPSAAVRWFDRWVMLDPTARSVAVRELSRMPTITEEIEERIRAVIGWLAGEGPVRPVGRTVGQHLATIENERGQLEGLLGRLLRDAGDFDGAYAALSRAAETSWNPQVFGEVAALATAGGDLERARQYQLFQLVDPLLSDAERDQLAATLLASSKEFSDFEGERVLASHEMRRRVFEGHRPIRAPTDAWLVKSPQGRSVDLLDEFGSTATIVRFWHPYDSDSMDRLQYMFSVCEELAEHGIRVLALTSEHAAPVYIKNLTIPEGCRESLFFESDDVVHRHFQLSFESEAIVLDREGTLQFRGVERDDVRRAALLVTSFRPRP